MQNWIERYLAKQETQFTQFIFPPFRRHSANISKSHYSQIESALFAINHPRNQSFTSNLNNSLSSKHILETNFFNKKNNNLPFKKRITRVRFNDASRTENQSSTHQNTIHTASQEIKFSEQYSRRKLSANNITDISGSVF